MPPEQKERFQTHLVRLSLAPKRMNLCGKNFVRTFTIKTERKCCHCFPGSGSNTWRHNLHSSEQKRENGNKAWVRILAQLFLAGKPVGIWSYYWLASMLQAGQMIQRQREKNRLRSGWIYTLRFWAHYVMTEWNITSEIFGTWQFLCPVTWEQVYIKVFSISECGDLQVLES